MSVAETSNDRAVQILDSAEQLLGEKGYDGVSIREVADLAGVNKALVFYYYKSKQGLFARVLERYYQAHQEALASAFTKEQGTLRERIHRMIDAYVDFIGSHQHAPRLVQNLLSRGDPEQLKHIQAQMAGLFHWIEDALRDVTPKTGMLAARHFYSDFSGLVVNYFIFAPVLGGLWGEDPLSEKAIEERREHLHWIVEALIDRLLGSTT